MSMLCFLLTLSVHTSFLHACFSWSHLFPLPVTSGRPLRSTPPPNKGDLWHTPKCPTVAGQLWLPWWLVGCFRLSSSHISITPLCTLFITVSSCSLAFLAILFWCKSHAVAHWLQNVDSPHPESLNYLTVLLPGLPHLRTYRQLANDSLQSVCSTCIIGLFRSCFHKWSTTMPILLLVLEM